MMQETYAKFREVAALEGGRRHVDPDDLLQEVLLEMYNKGKDPDENHGLVIARLRYVAIDMAKKQISGLEVSTGFEAGWEGFLEEPDTKRPGKKRKALGVVPSFELDWHGEFLVDFVREYIERLLAAKLDGDRLTAMRAYYLDGQVIDELPFSHQYARQLLPRARKRLDEDDLRDLGAWDDFNRATGGRRRLALDGAPRLAQVLIREGLT